MLHSSTFPRGMWETGSQEVETTLAGMSENKRFPLEHQWNWNASTEDFKFNKPTFQQNMPGQLHAATPYAFVGKNWCFIFIRFLVCLMACREDAHSGWHLENLLRAVSPEQVYLKQELLGIICHLHPKSSESATVADQHTGLLLVQDSSPDTLQDLTHSHAKKVSLLWPGWAKAFFSGSKFLLYYQAWTNWHITDSCP